MSSTELVREPTARSAGAAGRQLARKAVALIGVATGIGLLVQLLFVEARLGINWPITIGVLLVAAWLARDGASPPPGRADLWIAPAAMTLAVFVAIRGDMTLVALDVLGSLGLTGLAVASFSGFAVVRRPFERGLQLAGSVAGSTLVGGATVLATAREAAPVQAREVLARGVPVVRGLLIAIPLVVLFVVMFAAADAVFAQLTEDLFDWNLDAAEFATRVTVAAVAAWLAAGLLGLVALRGRTVDPDAAPMGAARPRIGTVECLIVLLALDALFAAFVVIQATYLFGGADTLAASGLTYAEYARRGFFELLAVAFMVAALILGLELFVTRRTRAYVLAAIVLVAMTLIVLASSLLRLRLYQDAYGWTELRFYVLAAICWLAIGAFATIGALATNRTRWLPHVMVILSVAFGVGFNIVGPVHFIAEQNVARALNPELVPADGKTGLDVYYLASLGTDADIVMAEAQADLPEPERSQVEQVLDSTAADLAADPYGQVWQAWNLSRERTRDLLVE